jgi:translation initiation factor 5B
MEQNKTIRTPIVAVLGHVDSGKTSFLDCVRSTNLVAKEAGLITQHIGATEVPISTVRKISGNLIQKFGFNLMIPGLLFIDTPGHESFSNLRERGSSIADLAVLMIDITKGLQSQTKEAITILKDRKVPFVVCLSKIDLVEGYESKNGSFLKNFNEQSENAKKILDEKLYSILGELFQKGFQSERFDRISDPAKEIALIPVSAKTGEGIPETLVFLAGLAQKFMEKNLKITAEGPGKGTVLEVREEKGLGTTIDVILYDGKLKIGDSFVVAGKSGVVRSKVRSLLIPNTLTDIRAAEKFTSIKEVHAATGIKIVAPDLGEALAGSPFLVEETGEEEKLIQTEVNRIKIDSTDTGVIVKADTLGSLEALITLLRSHNIKIRHADVGDVNKRDISEAVAIRSKDPFLGVIFAFNVHVSSEMKKEAEKNQVKIFSSNVVYNISEEYLKWKEEQENKKKEYLLKKAVFPVKLKFLPGFIFRHSKPAVIGVKVLEGRLKNGITVMNGKGKLIGRIQNIQSEKKKVEKAGKDEEVAVSIEGAVVERNLFENDILYGMIPKDKIELLVKLKKELTEEEEELLQKITELHSSNDGQEDKK